VPNWAGPVVNMGSTGSETPNIVIASKFSEFERLRVDISRDASCPELACRHVQPRVCTPFSQQLFLFSFSLGEVFRLPFLQPVSLVERINPKALAPLSPRGNGDVGRLKIFTVIGVRVNFLKVEVRYVEL
jgi:hypothetical protein